MEDLANLPPPSQVPSKHFQMFYLLCFWGLRNHCHDVVFRALPPSQYSRIAAKCVEDATLWANRLKSADRSVVTYWKEILSYILLPFNVIYR